MTFLSAAQHLPAPCLMSPLLPLVRFLLDLLTSSAARGKHVGQASPLLFWLECGSLYIECPKAAGAKV